MGAALEPAPRMPDEPEEEEKDEEEEEIVRQASQQPLIDYDDRFWRRIDDINYHREHLGFEPITESEKAALRENNWNVFFLKIKYIANMLNHTEEAIKLIKPGGLRRLFHITSDRFPGTWDQFQRLDILEEKHRLEQILMEQDLPENQNPQRQRELKNRENEYWRRIQVRISVCSAKRKLENPDAP